MTIHMYVKKWKTFLDKKNTIEMKVVALIDRGRIMSSRIYEARNLYTALDVIEIVDKEGNVVYLFPGEYRIIKEDRTTLKYKIKAFLNKVKRTLMP